MNKSRNLLLDVIRGFLSWVIVVVHVFWFADYRSNILASAGIYAVDGFIILSGFVMTGLLLTKKESYGIFIFRRFMRLFPAFAVCIVLVLLIRPYTLGSSASEFLRETSESRFFWWHLGAHASLLHGLIPSAWLPVSQIAFLPTGWSISLEFQLYLVAPLALWWLARSGFKGFALLAIPSVICLVPQVAARIGSVWPATGAFLPQRFLFFLLGIMIYLYSQGSGIRPALYRYWSGFVKLGEMSYSTYLVHYPVLACLTIFLPGNWSLLERAMVLFAAGAPITLFLSFLLYRYVELPGIQLGRYLTSKSRSPSAQVAARAYQVHAEPNFFPSSSPSNSSSSQS
jgi:peptidoglycan/LPS O-acetylase OafA/YrhL